MTGDPSRTWTGHGWGHCGQRVRVRHRGGEAHVAAGGATRVVVVTGASGGIGRASAGAFAARGDRVALLARGEKGLEAARRDVEEAGGTALVLPTDVTEYDAVVRA